MNAMTHLDRLEAEAIFIMREVVAEACPPCDAVFGRQGFRRSCCTWPKRPSYPAPPPFPLLHVDTTWKFRAMYELRDRAAAAGGGGADRPPQSLMPWRAASIPFDHGPLHTEIVEDRGAETGTHRRRLGRGVRRGPPRRGEEPRQGTGGSASAPSSHRWDPKQQRPELWQLYNARLHPGESIRVFRCRTGPSSTSGNISSGRASRWCRCTWPRRARWLSATAC